MVADWGESPALVSRKAVQAAEHGEAEQEHGACENGDAFICFRLGIHHGLVLLLIDAASSHRGHGGLLVEDLTVS